MSSEEIGGTPKAFHGTPVENHWNIQVKTSKLNKQGRSKGKVAAPGLKLLAKKYKGI